MSKTSLDIHSIKNLIKLAQGMQNLSYSPYSNFQVGAALLSNSGNIYTGCNIENISYSPTNCAERTAFFKAISDGDTNFSHIAIVGSLKDTDISSINYCMPCGVCLQVMSEFCDYDNFFIIVAKNQDDYMIYSLRELLPLSFNF